MGKEAFSIGRYKIRRLTRKLNLVVKKRIAHKVTMKRKESNPVVVNKVWTGDTTHLKMAEGRMYLEIVMDLFSRQP